MEAVAHQLDFPGVNCRQCNDNYQVDGIEPECKRCPVAGWDVMTRRLLVLYDQAVPAGDLDQRALEQALDDYDFSGRDRRLARRCLVAMHRRIKAHYQQEKKHHAD